MEKTAKIIIGIIVIAAVAYGVWYAASKPKTPASTEAIKIGLSVQLTGDAASYGQTALAGATLAVKEINDKGGIKGRKIELVPEDDKCSPEGVTAINKLVNVDKVTAILGPMCSGVANAGLPVAQSASIPSLIVASAPGITNIGDYIFRVYPSDDFQGSVGAEFIRKQLKKEKAAVIYVKNAWGEAIAKVFAEKFKELGGQVVYEGGILQTATDLKTEIAKVKESGADSLYMPVYPDNTAIAFKQAKEAGLNLPIVGSDSFENEEVFNNSYAEGVYYAAGKVNLTEGLKAKINSLPGFEKLQVSIWSPIGYDTIKIIATAIEKVGTDRAKLRDAIAKTSYKGISYPLIEFNSNRELKDPLSVVKVIKNKTAVEYSQ